MSSHSTCWTVIQRAAEGFREDQAEFARRYAATIRAYLAARWSGTPLSDHVDDAAQQVFLDCFRTEGALGRAERGRPGGFRAFLYGVVRNVARMAERNAARTKERQPISAFDLDAIASQEESLAHVFDRAWAAALLRDAAALQLKRARDKGPEAERRHRLLAVRYGENIPIREIAARWDVDAAILHREYPKAREEFKRALMEVVREQHGGGPIAVEEECERLLDHFS